MFLYSCVKTIVCFLVATLSLAGACSAFTLRQIEGTWDVTSTWSGVGAKATRKTTVVIKELGQGRFSLTETKKGWSRISTKEQFFPDGTSRLVSYDRRGRVDGTGKGTWRVVGSRMHYNYALTSKDASASWVGTATRVNRNRFEIRAKMSGGGKSYKIKAVYLRRR